MQAEENALRSAERSGESILFPAERHEGNLANFVLIQITKCKAQTIVRDFSKYCYHHFRTKFGVFLGHTQVILRSYSWIFTQ